MKRYCLKPEVKKDIIVFITQLFYSIILILFLSGLIALPFSFFIAPDNIVILILCYIGILSWTIVFSFIVISIKRWLQSSIIEC